MKRCFTFWDGNPKALEIPKWYEKWIWQFNHNTTKKNIIFVVMLPKASHKIILEIATGRQWPHFLLAQLSDICISKKHHQTTIPDCLSVISVHVWVMISFTHPGSVPIDLLNAEIDSREAEQPYWSSAFLIHSRGGKAWAGGSTDSRWANS